jgi:PAS domain S-box-containing protein
MNPSARFRRQIERSIALPTLLLGLLSVIFYALVFQLLTVLDQVDQSDRLIARVLGASEQLLEMDAALKAYLDVGTSDSLASYRAATSRVGDAFEAIAQLVSRGSDQSRRLASIRELSDRWAGQASEVIALRSASRLDRAAEKNHIAGRIMDAIHGRMSAFRGVEEVSRDRRSRTARFRSRAILAGCSGLAISLVILIVYVSRASLAALCGSFEAALEALQLQVDRREQERLNMMSQAMKQYAIFTLDTEGRITSWNADSQRLLGFNSDDVLNRRMSFLYSEEDLQSDRLHHDLDWAAVEGRTEDERLITRKDGFRFKARISLVAIRDSIGTLCGFTHVVRECEED